MCYSWESVLWRIAKKLRFGESVDCKFQVFNFVFPFVYIYLFFVLLLLMGFCFCFSLLFFFQIIKAKFLFPISNIDDCNRNFFLSLFFALWLLEKKMKWGLFYFSWNPNNNGPFYYFDILIFSPFLSLSLCLFILACVYFCWGFLFTSEIKQT